MSKYMSKYRLFPENKEVADVLCCLIMGKKKVKDIMKVLKQPQSTVSEKLRFLLRSKVVRKNKWVFEPNWNAIVKVFQREVKKYFEEPLEIMKMDSELDKGSRRLIENIRDMNETIPVIFNKKRVAAIYKKYADYFLKGWMEKMSVSELASSYLDILKHTDTSEFKKFKSDIASIKKLFNKIGIKDIKESLFVEVEREIKGSDRLE